MRWGLELPAGQSVRRLIEAVGCTLHFLPGSSPDDDPIALTVSQLKTVPRRTGAGTRDGRDAAITTALPS